MGLMRTQRSGWQYALLVLGLVLLAALVMDFNSRMAELRRLTAEREVVQARVTAQVETQVYLQTQLVHATSDAAVMQWAYEEGHMVRPGDNPVVPIAPDEPTPVPTPTALPAPVETSNLEAWIALFFGPRTP